MLYLWDLKYACPRHDVGISIHLMGIVDGNCRVEIYIHLLDLTSSWQGQGPQGQFIIYTWGWYRREAKNTLIFLFTQPQHWLK
jgi:hypothetical protein